MFAVKLCGKGFGPMRFHSATQRDAETETKWPTKYLTVSSRLGKSD